MRDPGDRKGVAKIRDQLGILRIFGVLKLLGSLDGLRREETGIS